MLEGIETDRWGAAGEGLLVQQKTWSQRAEQVPGKRGLDIDQVRKGTGLLRFGQELETVHVEKLRGRAERAAIKSVATQDDIVGVHLLNETVDSRAGRLDLGRNSSLIVGAEPIITRQRERLQGGIAGFFRTHTRKGITLDPDDLTVLDAHFRDPHHIGLLVRPFATKASTGGIFIREGGKIFVDWPHDPTSWGHVAPGDQMVVDGRFFTILAIQEFPRCYSAVYAEEL